jgi:hypothetical protein
MKFPIDLESLGKNHQQWRASFNHPDGTQVMAEGITPMDALVNLFQKTHLDLGPAALLSAKSEAIQIAKEHKESEAIQTANQLRKEHRESLAELAKY